MPLKTVGLLLPTGLVVLIYMLPLVQAIWPGFAAWLNGVGPAGSTPFLILGIALALLGRAIGLGAAWVLHHDDGLHEAAFDLQTRGFFSFTRNPILVGMYVAFIGLWFLYPSWEMGVGFLLFVANMHFRVLLEEDYLRYQFGPEYDTFLAATRRYI